MAVVGATAQAVECPLTWDEFFKRCDALVIPYKGRNLTGVYGIPTGGSFVALRAAQTLCVPFLSAPEPDCLVLDDIVDSGNTMRPYAAVGYDTDALFRKYYSPSTFALHAEETTAWIRFPWEHETPAEDAVTRLLEMIGEDPTRDGLRDTPKRVVKALREMTAGYGEDAAAILARSFDVHYDEMVVLRDIRFHSMCEHHMLPFDGYAHVGYIPREGGPVVGISKLARLVECFARRLQIQERLTQQIAGALMRHLEPLGVAVVIQARHACMGCRGVRNESALMETSSMHGKLREDAAARAEFFALCRKG